VGGSRTGVNAVAGRNISIPVGNRKIFDFEEKKMSTVFS
jgi:hypothetical protein